MRRPRLPVVGSSSNGRMLILNSGRLPRPSESSATLARTNGVNCYKSSLSGACCNRWVAHALQDLRPWPIRSNNPRKIRTRSSSKSRSGSGESSKNAAISRNAPRGTINPKSPKSEKLRERRTETRAPIPSEMTESLWASTRAPGYPKLDHDDLFVDVAVVGGGITGVTAALLLKLAGKKVALLEARRIGSGVTSGTTGHLTEAIDTRYRDLERTFGADGAALVAASSRAAIEA